jgi:hypothetical protein
MSNGWIEGGGDGEAFEEGPEDMSCEIREPATIGKGSGRSKTAKKRRTAKKKRSSQARSKSGRAAKKAVSKKRKPTTSKRKKR